jgi:hypothetical protein
MTLRRASSSSKYSEDDFGENVAALRLSNEEFAASVNSEWHGRIMDYDAGKALGYKKPTHDLAVKLLQWLVHPAAAVALARFEKHERGSWLPPSPPKSINGKKRLRSSRHTRAK